jgi:hypothetical protein
LEAARSRRFSGPAQRERVTQSIISDTLIQKGDWCSEELTPNPNETMAMVRMLMTAKKIDQKISFSRHRVGFFA